MLDANMNEAPPQPVPDYELESTSGQNSKLTALDGDSYNYDIGVLLPILAKFALHRAEADDWSGHA